MNRYLPVIVFVLTSLIGLAMTYAVYVSARATELVRFEVIANDAVDRVRERINQHIALLIATEAHVDSGVQLTRAGFAKYIQALQLEKRYEGVRGIGFAQIILTGDEGIAESQLLQGYGKSLAIYPNTEQRIRTPIIMLEPNDERNNAALGFDMFSEENRRNAMLQALLTGHVTATGPVELVQEITEEKQAGFLVYQPPSRSKAIDLEGDESFGALDGFVYAAFRAGDLHKAALNRSPKLPLAVETVDITSDEPIPLYKSENFDAGARQGKFSVSQELEIAGRKWLFTFYETDEFSVQTSYFAVFMLGSLSLLFAAALAVSTRSQLKAVETSKTLQAVSLKASEEKDMLLQEMKHRIKNSIARIMAMSRQTAASSPDMDAYSKSFSARLQSMANAQDILTGSGTGRTNIRLLLSKELEQIFGQAFDQTSLSGPEIQLDGKAAQALGLVFHELATNALKYGMIDSEEGGLNVSWKLDGRGRNSFLELKWQESSPKLISPPARNGFGSKLIDANIRGELCGSLEKDFRDHGLLVTMRFPYGARHIV